MTEQDELDNHFPERLRAIRFGTGRPAVAGDSDRQPFGKIEGSPGAVRAGSALSVATCLELFDAQLGSRHLDLAARWLRERGRGFYTIGSSGHEGNAGVAAALRVTEPRAAALPVRRVLPGPRLPGRPATRRTARQRADSAAGRAAGRAARPGGGRGGADRRRAAQGVRPC